jgi:hypothetical protein
MYFECLLGKSSGVSSYHDDHRQVYWGAGVKKKMCVHLKRLGTAERRSGWLARYAREFSAGRGSFWLEIILHVCRIALQDPVHRSVERVLEIQQSSCWLSFPTQNLSRCPVASIVIANLGTCVERIFRAPSLCMHYTVVRMQLALLSLDRLDGSGIAPCEARLEPAFQAKGCEI